MDLPKYPLDVLYRARDSFAQNWKKSYEKNPIAKRIYDMHINFPPNIQLLNTLPYPFEKANTFCPHPDALLLRERAPNQSCKRPHSDTYSSLLSEEVFCKKRLSDPELGQITERAINMESARYSHQRDQNRMKVDKSQSEMHFFYGCDVCDTDFMTHSQAISHGNETNHPSLSQYTCNVDEDSDSGGESRIPTSSTSSHQLTKPREILISKDPDFGWREGESVVFCPSCHLITPDKIAGAYHHQSVHTGRKPIYCIGQVLEAKIFQINFNFPRCERCRITFQNIGQLLSHWIGKKLICSPFTSSYFCSHIIHLQCAHCDLQRDRTVLHDGSSDKLVSSEVNRRATSAAHTVCVNLITHLLSHFRSRTCFGVQVAFRYRFICIDAAYRKEYHTLPPYSLLSTDAILLHSYQETKKMQVLLKAYRNSRKSMLKLANAELDRLRIAISRNIQPS